MSTKRFEITVESNDGVNHDIFFDLPEEFPEAEITGSLKKTRDAPTITHIAIDRSQLIIGIIALVQSFIDAHQKKDKGKNKMTLTDKKNGRKVEIPTGTKSNPSEIIAKFLHNNSRKKK